MKQNPQAFQQATNRPYAGNTIGIDLGDRWRNARNQSQGERRCKAPRTQLGSWTISNQVAHYHNSQ
jgi:hypothetical protein